MGHVLKAKNKSEIYLESSSLFSFVRLKKTILFNIKYFFKLKMTFIIQINLFFLFSSIPNMNSKLIHFKSNTRNESHIISRYKYIVLVHL